MPSQEDIKERKEIWGWICWWMNKFGLTPRELAPRARYSQELIEKGIKGEPVPIRHALCNFVEAFGLTSGRTKHYEETIDILSDDECKKLLKPPLATSTYQSNFWND